MQKTITSKDKMTMLAQLIVNCCSHDEIDKLCVALLDANMKCKLQNERNKLCRK